MDRAGQSPAIIADAPGALASAGAAAMTQLRALGPGRILALGAVGLAMLGFFAFLILRAVEQPYTLLFGGMELADSRRLVERLDALGVPYRLSPDGNAVMVPADQALRLRMSLAEEGLPTGGTVGNELFDGASGLTTTDFLSDVNLRRALEGELARTIAHLQPVRSARVHLVQPKRELFRRDTVRASASIVLSLTRGADLDKRQVAGIRHLVAGAVPGLQIDAISIVDDRGNLLARPEEGAGLGVGLEDALDYRIAYEDRVRLKLLQLLERSVGIGRVDVEVAADFDFDEVATTAETFDPESQVARSTQTTEESSNRSDVQPQDQVSVANNLPTESGPAAGNAAKSDERTQRTEETTNFEISRTVRNEKRRGAVLRQLSIAVQVDHATARAADGSVSLLPRSAEELEQLETLVRSAAGVDERRGDVVRIVSRPFVVAESDETVETPVLGLDRDGWWRLAELATLAVLGLMMLFFGVRPAIRRLLPATAELPAQIPALPAGLTPAADRAGLVPAPSSVDGVTVDIGVDARQAVTTTAPATLTQLPQVRGLVRSSLVEEVSRVVAENPADAVRVVRGWLHGS